MHDCDVSEEGASAALGCMALLRRVYLDTCTLVDPAPLRHLVDLQELRVAQHTYGVDRTDWLRSLPHAMTWPDLTILVLGGLGVCALEDIDAVASLPKLQVLELSYGSISDAGLARLLPLQQLQALKFRGGPGAMSAGLRQLTAFTALQCLEIKGGRTDAHAGYDEVAALVD